jgi:hypothetical protein
MCLGVPDCQPEPARSIPFRMSDAEKKARLAEALRQNLRKRTAQARAKENDESHEDPPKTRISAS